MVGKVGPKGRVVIERRIREQLGIRPGGKIRQQVVVDHVESRIHLAEHTHSLAGAARPYIRRWPRPEEFGDLGWLWSEEARDKFRVEEPERQRCVPSPRPA